ncbi:hypothetical protein [Variovorax sp. JS1663]|uniref:hypothetical protein n=1 Tax=Variovorax sp. JS1663 TaxID=1851577 RepID=UPI000B341FD7|nr:hypothetical protein [Variovorax sp. JS1663]OUL98006.1 hypothetical protein A8M77_33785 [Variovorax sp. JS1663]
MSYEVDFFAARTGGAAIAVRWGAPGNYRLLVYDGGTRASGLELVKHIREHCQSKHVDYVVCSQPDYTHAEGLELVFERLSIGALWMHRPWRHSRRVMPPGISIGRRLEQLALDRRIPIHEPYAGAAVGPFTVLSPNRSWYMEQLLPAFGRPQPLLAGLTLADAARWARLVSAGFGSRWDYEPLPHNPRTNAEDESSAVLYGEFESRGVLLTGDAGIRALSHACACAEQLGLAVPSNLRMMQVPGRGGPHHLSSVVLNRLVGERLPRAQRHGIHFKTAFMSAPPGAPPLGYRVVADALQRRGVFSYLTQGTQLYHAHEMPDRGWGPAMRVGVKDW